MIKLRRFLFIGGAFLLLLVKFTIDVISKNVELEVGGLSLIREATVVGAFLLLSLTVFASPKLHEQPPMRRLGVLLVLSYGVLFLAIAFNAINIQGFDRKNLSLLPLDYPTLFLASIVSIILGVFALLTLRFLRELVFYQRRRGTQRNFFLLLGAILCASGSVVMLRPLDSSAITAILLGATVLFAVMNSFRLPWIVYLSKREKIIALVYGLFLFLAFTGIDVALVSDSNLRRSLLYYSYPLREFVQLSALFGNIYFGMAFVSTLFHLPTAEAFERKRSEVTSLHNLSRLITQILDFKELVDTVTSMTQQVCEATSCWLELIQYDAGAGTEGQTQGGSPVKVSTVAYKNITLEEIEQLHGGADRQLRREAMARRAPVVIDDVYRDRRFEHLKKAKSPVASLVAMPLISHSGLIGLLYATKSSAYGFVKDDIDVIAAFADQAAIAIENSRLIGESIERERIIREMMLAQEMQRRLLPQNVPVHPAIDIDALSTPAFEVGGDYYDFVQLGKDRLGIVVGDVSGKGVPAAFYMSEVKGIFQSLSTFYTSPRDLLVRANEILAETVDRHSFVSLLFAVIDLCTGQLTMVRAGHCPMLLASAQSVEYIRPGGMGLGLSRDSVFRDSLEEHHLGLQTGDVCLFYTDGVPEAMHGSEEYGYERLLVVARDTRHTSAPEIKNAVMASVQGFVKNTANHDDITLVVLKWNGCERSPA
ncbi:MAG: GAF domain-containing SpoIIE family protein phosphatase [Bacteroidota bacterium]